MIDLFIFVFHLRSNCKNTTKRSSFVDFWTAQELQIARCLHTYLSLTLSQLHPNIFWQASEKRREIKQISCTRHVQLGKFIDVANQAAQHDHRHRSPFHTSNQFFNSVIRITLSFSPLHLLCLFCKSSTFFSLSIYLLIGKLNTFNNFSNNDFHLSGGS